MSCHNNNLTAMTVAAARKQGIRVDDGVARAQVKAIAAYVEGDRERYLQGISIAGGADTTSYILLGMAAESWPPDPATDAMARYLKARQRWTDPGEPSGPSANPIGRSTKYCDRDACDQVYIPQPDRAEYEKRFNLRQTDHEGTAVDH